MAANLGIALGAATNQMNYMDEAKRRQAADARAQESHDFTMKRAKEAEAEEAAFKSALSQGLDGRRRLMSGDMSPFDAAEGEYNTNTGIYGNGYKLVRDAASKKLRHVNPKGEVVDEIDDTPESRLKLYDRALDYKLSQLSPTYYQKVRDGYLREQEAKESRQHAMTVEELRDQRARDMQRDGFKHSEKMQAGSPAWAQLNLSREEKEAARQEREATAAARVEIYKEQNPGATPAQLEAVRRGVVDAVPSAKGYKTEAGDVTSLLGKPAVDGKGNPVADPLTGRQMVNRDPTREQEFWNYMRNNNITDTNKGLQLFLAQGGGQPGGAKAVQAPPVEQRKVGQTYSTPRGAMVWRGNGWEPAQK